MKNRITLYITGDNVRYIDCVVEEYLWIGDDDRCYGCVPDRDIEKLRDMCNGILAQRRLTS